MNAQGKFTEYRTQHQTPCGDTVTTVHEIDQDGESTGTHIILEVIPSARAKRAAIKPLSRIDLL